LVRNKFSPITIYKLFIFLKRYLIPVADKLLKTKLVIINILKNARALKLGRDKFVWAMGSNNLKSSIINLLGSKMIKKVENCAIKKTDGSWFFGSLFIAFYRFLGLYGFIEKQAPQKALCLGPDPPPGENYKFYRFLPIF
jgi:hypothetical protein